jgi:hypothetical protein
MRPDMKALLLGRLVFTDPQVALDDARFERVISGFGGHYLVTPTSPDSFTFQRGEGFDKFERWDAFAYVDQGHVTRLRDPDRQSGDGNIIMLPRFTGLQFSLNMRVFLVFWAFAFAVAWFFLHGDPMFWGIGFLALYGLYVSLIISSLKKKMARWTERKSWN